MTKRIAAIHAMINWKQIPLTSSPGTIRYGKIWRGVQFNRADLIIKEGRRELLTLPVIGLNLNTEVQIQVLSKSKFYPSVLLGAQKIHERKRITQIYFKLNPISFKAPPAFSLLWLLQGSRSLFLKKGNWRGYIGCQPAVAVIKNGKNLF